MLFCNPDGIQLAFLCIITMSSHNTCPVVPLACEHEGKLKSYQASNRFPTLFYCDAVAKTATKLDKKQTKTEHHWCAGWCFVSLGWAKLQVQPDVITESSPRLWCCELNMWTFISVIQPPRNDNKNLFFFFFVWSMSYLVSLRKG